MKDINIAKIFLKKRKEKALTQDQVASYLGVSKASVSKWETNTSYPDIALLPQIASYFDISIDELIGYNPYLSKDQIRELYQHLTAEITKRPAEETLTEWREIVKKYYACYPLLTQMGTFMLNNIELVTDPQEREALLHEIIALFERVRAESTDTSLTGFTLKLEASAYLFLGDADKTLFLLEDWTKEPAMPPELLVAAAYQAKGLAIEAKRTIQVGLLQNIIVYFNYINGYIPMVLDDNEAFGETIKRAYTVAECFNLKELHPLIQLSLDFMVANAYTMRGEREKALDALESLVQSLNSHKVLFDLHGDSYFDLVDPWLANLDTGKQSPRNMTLVKEEMVEAVCQNPTFESLKEEKRYQAVLTKLSRLKKV